MKKIYLSLAITFLITFFHGQCSHQFNMYDSFGDGWNGNAVDISINGTTVISGATLASGSFDFVNFNASTGDVIDLTNWITGNWTNEVSWNITDGDGIIIASGLFQETTAGATGFCPSCPSPPLQFLSAFITNPNTANLSWIPGGTETSWNIQYGNSGFTIGTGNTVSTSSNPYSLTGLNSSTLYDYYIQGVCSINELSQWSGPYTFTTSCSSVLAPYVQNFSSGALPICWSQSALNGGGWEFTGTPGYDAGNNSRPDDTYAWIDFSGTDAETVMELVPIDISALSNVELEFDFFSYDSSNGSSPANIMHIEAFNGASWVIINSIQDNTVGGWNTYTYIINGYDNQGFVYLRFRGESGGANNDYFNDLLVDDVYVGEAMANDLELLSGTSNSYCDFSNTEIISIEIVNSAANAQSNFDVSYTINGGLPVIENFSNTINPGDTITYSFNTTADLSSDGVYNFEYECLLTGDQNSANNNLTLIVENYLSPILPTTIDDTICLGDTAFLEAVTNQGLINWYSDPNGSSAISTNAVNPYITTTYYAEVQASNFYNDDFESFPTGSLIAQSSAYWTTLSGAGGGPFDAFISGAQMSSGNSSIYVNQLNDDDLYLLINPLATDGVVEISMDLRIETSAHINFQDQSNPASIEIFEITLNSGVLGFDIGPTVLNTSYPGNNTWFNLKLEGNLALSTWDLYIDGVFVFGSYIAGADQIGAVNFRPEVGDEYYIDDVEWYVIGDDDCISGLSPLTITVENCSSIDEKVNQSLNLYPNPTNVVLNFNGTNIFEYIQVIDNHGKVVLENIINSNKGKLDLSYLNRGIYFVKAFSNSGIIHKKIILN